MPGRFLDISHLWGSIFNGQIVSTFCNPPLQFNDIDTRQFIAYPAQFRPQLELWHGLAPGQKFAGFR